MATSTRTARVKKPKKKAEPKLTFGRLFPGALKPRKRPESPSWRIGGSGVSWEPVSAPLTRRVVEALRAAGVTVRSGGSSGFGAADAFTLDAPFLDGGLRAKTGNYLFGRKGAWVHGPRAALFVAALLDVRVPKPFLVQYGLEDVKLDRLRAAACVAAKPGRRQPYARGVCDRCGHESTFLVKDPDDANDTVICVECDRALEATRTSP